MRRKTRLMLVSAILISSSYGALAASVDPMQAVYGNTVVLTGSDKLQTLTQFTADGRFVGRIPSFNYLYSGTWKIDSTGNLCKWYDLPVPNRPNPECINLAPHSVGDTWTTSGATVSIVLGTQ